MAKDFSKIQKTGGSNTLSPANNTGQVSEFVKRKAAQHQQQIQQMGTQAKQDNKQMILAGARAGNRGTNTTGEANRLLVGNARAEYNRAQIPKRSLTELADEAEQVYQSYISSDVYKQKREAYMQDALNRGMNPYELIGLSLSYRDDVADELKAKAGYYRTQVQQEADNAVMARDMNEFKTWSPADQAALMRYVAENNAEPFVGEPTFQNARYNAQELIDKYGAQKVMEMAESYRRSKNQEISETTGTMAQEAADSKGGAVLHSALSVGANVANAITSPVGYVQEMVGRTGRYSTLDPNNAGNVFSQYAGNVRQKVAENIAGDKHDENGNQVEDGGFLRQAGATLYEAGMSAADSLARIFFAGGNKGLSLGLAATGSFGQTVSNASAQGANPVQAVAMGIVDGGLEVLTEKISLDNLFKEAAAGPKNLMQVMKSIFKSGAIEVSEEEMSFLGSTIAEAAILQEKSSYNQQVGQLMAQGKGYIQARQEANRELLMEAVETGVQSFLSGGMMGGYAQVKNARRTSKIGKTFGEMNFEKADVQDLIDSGLESAPDTEAYQIAQEVQRQVKEGKTPSNYDLARLWQANEQAIQEEREENAISIQDGQETAQPAVVDVTKNAPGVTPEAQTVIGNGQNVTQNTPNVTAAVVGPSQSVAAQLRQNQTINGGMINGTEQRIAGSAAADLTGTAAGAGAGLLSGSGQRYDGAGTREQAGILAGRARRSAQSQALVDQRRATVDRQNRIRSLQLPKISSKDLGLPSGTESRNIQLVPQEHYDAEMEQLFQRVYHETGKTVSFVMGKLQVRGADGNVRNVNGVVYDDKIVVRADHLRLSMEQIADHEAYHAKTDRAREGGADLNAEIRRHIVETFSEEEFRAVLGKYVEALRGVYDVGENQSGEDHEQLMRQIQEEVFADAYAGINAFGAGADRFTSAVNEKMEQLGTGRFRSQENGVRETNGPPAERFSYDKESEEWAGSQTFVTGKDSNTRMIYPGMDDSERAEILMQKEIRVPAYDDSNPVNGAQIIKLKGKYVTKARSLLTELARQCGTFSSDYHNAEIDINFAYSNKSLKESVSKQAKRGGGAEEFGKMLTVLPEICESAVEIEAHTDRYAETARADEHLKEMHVLLGAFNDGTGVVPVQLEIKEFLPESKQGNKLYVTVTIKEAGVTPRGPAAEMADVSFRSRPASIISLAELIRDVKDNTGDLVKYFPDSMLTAEQKSAKEQALERDETRLNDMRYEYAIENQNTEKALGMLRERAAEKGYSKGNEYRMAHRAPDSQSGVSLVDADRAYGGDGSIYSPAAAMYYGEGRSYDSKAIRAFTQANFNPESSITVYRAVPNNVHDTKLRNGDWVSPTREYALEHGERTFDDGYRVVSQKVPVKHLFVNGDSIHEFGYDNGRSTEVYKSTRNNVKLDEVTYDDSGHLIPLSKRYDDTASDERFSVDDMDQAYMDAVNSGDVDTAQQMVDEAAKAAGYARLFYHGAKKGGGFTVFRDWSYFTENRKYAERYSERGNTESLYKTYVKLEKPFDTRNAGERRLFAQMRNEYGLGEIQESGLPDWTDGYDISDFIDENDLDYDGIVLDEGGDLVNGIPVSRGLSYVVRKSAQIKSADPVVYDDSGRVIPLSERFNFKNPDIRYSVDDETDVAGQQVQVPEQKQEMPKRRSIKLVAESRPIIAKKDLRNTMMNLFSIPDGSRAELGAMIDSYADRLIKNGALTEADRKAFFDRMYDAGVMTIPADDYFSEGRNLLKGGRVYVSDSVRKDFGDDWGDIRRRAFGAGIYFTSDRSAVGIDSWNHELAQELPGLFDSEETDLRSILERIVEVAEEGKDEKLSLAEYTARLAEQDYISEREFLDNMERQMDWALRTFAEKARLEVHLRDRTGVRIAKERAEHQEMAQRQKDRKELRELQQKTLKSLQWLNKNRNRAPEELKAAFDEVLSDIDIYAVGAANEMRWSDKYNATWKDLGQMFKDASKNDPNFLPSKELERIVARLDGTKIAEMDIGALNDLYKAAVGLRTEFYNRNNVISDEMNRLFAEVYTDAKKEIEAAPGGYSGKKIDKFVNLDQLTPMNVLQRMGGWDPDGAFYSMAKQLEKGERDMRAYSVKAQKMLQEFLTEHADWVKKADGQGKDGIWYEVQIPELIALELGKKPKFGATITVNMTPAQKVHLYLESKNVDNLRHMTGGRTFADKKLYSEGKRQEALAQGKTVRMAPETVKAIVSDLTAEEMELAQILEQYYNSFATQEINRVSNILYGYDKAMGKNYAPIYTNRNYTKTEFGVFDQTAEGVGNLKGRQYAVNPSYNISAFDAFEKHVDQTARFVGMAIPSRNWTTLMNWREQKNSTGDVITHKWGEEGKRYITDLLNTLQAGDDVKSDTVSSAVSKLQSTYITAIFGANPSIVLKQLGSIPLASAYLDARNMPTAQQIRNIDRELIGKYTQDLEWRTMGYSMPETKQLKENPNWTQTNKFYRFAFGGGAITAMDGWAASVLWPWAENKVRRDFPDLEIGNQAQIENGESPFYKKVAELFEDALSRSQSTSDEIHQSSLRKSKNPITKAFTMFRSDSAQTYNTLRQKIGEAQYYMRTGAKEQVKEHAKKAVGAAFVSLLLNSMWSEAINFLMALWKNKGKNYRDDEEELTFLSVAGEMASGMVGSFGGIVTGGEEVLEIIGNLLTGEKIYDIETPGIEQLNDLVTAVTDAGGSFRDVVAGAADVAVHGGDMGDYFGKHSGEILGSIKDLAETVVMYLPGLPVSGLPASNLEAYLLGAVKWLSPELGAAYDDLFSTVGKSGLSGLEGDALTSRVGRILDDREVSQSEDTAKALAALYEAGHRTAVPGDTPTSISIDGEKHTLRPFEQQAYDNIWNSIVSDALDELVASDSFMEAGNETQAKMLSKLYDYAAEQAKAGLFEAYEADSAAEKIAEIHSAGLELADCIAWTAETSGMKQTDKFKTLRQWDMPNNVKKTIMGTILGTEMETEAGNPTQYAEMLDALKQGISVNQYLDMRMKDADIDDYLDYVDSGMDEELAFAFVNRVAELEAEAGNESLEDLVKWRASVDFSDDVENQLIALSGVMTDSQFQQVEIANSFGVTPRIYVELQDIKSKYDADGNGSYKNAEIKAAIDAMQGKLNAEQKAVLWQLVTGSTSARNNPYSREVGQKVLDAKDAAKEKAESEEEEETFSDAVMKQLLNRK